MKIFNILIIISLLYSSLTSTDWRDYPTCKIGRLQSPIQIKEYESIYANNFSFVYQSYKQCQNCKIKENYTYTIDCSEVGGGYINFERGGVIKQYEFIRAELYNGLHEVNGIKGEYELHLIHRKNLDFVTNKNQYRSIQDPNLYLVVVLRYLKDCNENEKVCTSDNGLMENITSCKTSCNFNLNDYKIFQDKRAYFYEGSFVHIPCDENVNYYIVKDFFKLKTNISSINLGENNIPAANLFGRPVYKNFMNYREVLGNDYFSFKTIFASFLFIIILL
jgi:carbonic anhydrase